jgi:hypothetical protein
MIFKIIPIVLSIFLMYGCAQVPKESVELSATVGRDLAVMHKAHAQLATLLFERMKQDVNRFVDGTYAPYQIKNAMERQQQLADSKDSSERNKSLLLAINAASQPGSSEKLQSAVLKGMGSLIKRVRNDVEAMRSDLLNPIIEQEVEALGSINRAYQQIHYANSIVTGHLSSIVNVHEVQSDLLSEFGVERDLRKEIGERVASASLKITRLVDNAEKVGNKLKAVESTAVSLKSTIEELKSTLTKKENK